MELPPPKELREPELPENRRPPPPNPERATRCSYPIRSGDHARCELVWSGSGSARRDGAARVGAAALAGRPVTIDGNTLATDVQLMLRLQRLARLPGAEERAARGGPRGAADDHGAHRRRPADRRGALAAGRRPAGPALRARPGAPPVGPLLVFFHGGGFWCGDLDTHDALCRFLAEQAGVRVLSVDYRLGPEHPFPAAHDDAVAAYAWTVEHAAELGADPARLGVGGDSAGGNLAAVRGDRGGPAGLAAARCSCSSTRPPRRTARPGARSCSREGFYLTQRRSWTRPTGSTRHGVPADDPRLSPHAGRAARAAWPRRSSTPPGFDPLRDEGEAYADRLRAAGADGRADPVRRPDPRLLQHRRRRADLAGREPADRHGRSGPRCPDRDRATATLGGCAGSSPWSWRRCSRRRPSSPRPCQPAPTAVPPSQARQARGRCSSATPTSSAVAAAPTRRPDMA